MTDNFPSHFNGWGNSVKAWWECLRHGRFRLNCSLLTILIMPNTYSKMYCQVVFAVKFRNARIQNSFKSELFSVIGNLIKEAGGELLIVNGVEDHVHCLFRFFPKNSISDIVKVAKSKSSKWLNETSYQSHRFEWQSGFGVFTYSEKEIQNVFEYVKNQEKHHSKMTFQEEYLLMLKAHKVEFLPEYLIKEME